MILSIKWQVLMFFMAVSIGFLMGLLYDFIRVLRRIFLHKDFLVQIEDFAYWLICSLLVFFIALYQNSGEIRFFFILGIFLGMILYFCTLSVLFIKFSTIIIGFLKKVFIITFKLIYTPLKMFFKVLSYPLKFILKKLIKLAKLLKILLKNSKFYAIIKDKGIKLKYSIRTPKKLRLKKKTKEKDFYEE